MMSGRARQSVVPGAAITGVGIGLRSPHIDQLLATLPDIPWLEILADNHTAAGGRVAADLLRVAAHYPLTLHCVGMSLGGTDELDWHYLHGIKRVAEQCQPAWISDHLCFTALDGTQYHDLLPLPYTGECVRHVARRIDAVQDFLGRRLLIENVSSYVTYRHSVMSEAEFISALCAECDCDLLLDVNNIHVSAHNHGFAAQTFLDQVPLARVREVHLAGYEDQGDYLLDAHNHPVFEPVWELYRQLLQRAPDIPALIEWDNDIPPLAVLLAEADKARQLQMAARDMPT